MIGVTCCGYVAARCYRVTPAIFTDTAIARREKCDVECDRPVTDVTRFFGDDMSLQSAEMSLTCIQS
jgi:hypothetical protein